MKRKLLLIGILSSLLFGCNDGDLAIERISFDNLNVMSCTRDISATFLFKYNNSQALILTLPNDVLKNEENTIKGSISTDYKLFYRTFNASVSNDYFCGVYPPASPSVVSQIEATGGDITITTKPIYDERTNELLRYDHIISIKNLVLMSSEGVKIMDSDFNFGTYQTAP